jgi:hypothetical protein
MVYTMVQKNASKNPPLFYYETYFMFRMMLFPALLFMSIGLCIKIWTMMHINYIFIFQLKPKNSMSNWIFFLMASILYFVLILSFIFYLFTVDSQFFLYINLKGYNYLIPIILIVLIIIWIILPINIFYYDFRFF